MTSYCVGYVIGVVCHLDYLNRYMTHREEWWLPFQLDTAVDSSDQHNQITKANPYHIFKLCISIRLFM